MPCANNINLDRPSLHKYKSFHLSACKTVLIKYARENANPSADKWKNTAYKRVRYECICIITLKWFLDTHLCRFFDYTCTTKIFIYKCELGNTSIFRTHFVTMNLGTMTCKEFFRGYLKVYWTIKIQKCDD